MILISFSCLYIVIVCVLCFLPNIGSPIETFCDEENLKISSIANLSVTSLAILLFSIDNIVDTIYLGLVDHLKRIKLIMWLLLITSFSSAVLSLVVIIPLKSFGLISSVTNSIELIFADAIFFTFNFYGPSIWKWIYLIPTITIMAVAIVCTTFISHSESDMNQILNIISLTCNAIFLFLFLILSSLWIRHFYICYRSLSNDDVSCMINVLFSIIFFICRFVLRLVYKFDVDEYCNTGYYYYIFYSYIIVFIVINMRVARSALIMSNASNEVDTKRMLISYFSHHVRTPLNSLLMGLEIIKREMSTRVNINRVLSTLDDLTGQCDMIVDILNDLLLFDRLDDGVIELDMTPVQMKAFLERKLSTLRSQIREKEIRLIVDFVDINQDALTLQPSLSGRGDLYSWERVYWRGDEEKLSQVLRTLLTNASECTVARGTIRVTIELLTEEAVLQETRCPSLQHAIRRNSSIFSSIQTTLLPYSEAIKCNSSMISSLTTLQQFPQPVLPAQASQPEVKLVVRIQVTDNGPGLNQSDMVNIFQNALRFTSGVLDPNEDKRLGLQIAHRIVTVHGGQLSVSSDGLGCGSTYTILLPAHFPNANGRMSFRQVSFKRSLSAGSSSSMQPLPANTPRGCVGLPYDDDDEDVSVQSMRGQCLAGRSSGAGNGMETSAVGVGTDACFSRSRSYLQPSPRKYPVPQMQLQHAPVHPEEGADRDAEDFQLHSACNVHVHSSRKLVALSTGFVRSTCVQSQEKTEENVTVLVVDDALLNRKMLCQLLEGSCDAAEMAEDGAIAVDKMRQSMIRGAVFALVLMDYQMPNMDGPTAAEAMRKMGYTGPIIGVTGNSLPLQINTFIAAGANRVMCKPLKFEALKRTLREIGFADILVSRKSDKSAAVGY